MSELAIFDGPKAVQSDPGDAFNRFPSEVKEEIKEAVLDVLDEWSMSGINITKEFEQKFADWHGKEYGLGFNNGTSAVRAAMFAAGIGKEDEIICPSITFWASCLQVYSLRGNVVFCDIEPDTLCLDPEDVERKITDRTKAIMVVHYAGMPADMDAIMDIAKRHDIKVIEDVSHSHGALYKGQMVGTFGDVSAFSLMSGKSFATGEGGVLITDNREIYERAMAFGLYARHRGNFENDYIKEGLGLPWGGFKNRMHQMSSAVALVQLDYYPEQIEKIEKSMNFFWDQLEGLPGLGDHRRPEEGYTKGGWYAARGLYRPEELEGLSITRLCQAVRAEGVSTSPGVNKALHLHPIFNSIDVYNEGEPTAIANAAEDIRTPEGSLPVSEGIQERTFSIPLFYNYRPEVIKEYAKAFRKVVENYKELLDDDPGNPDTLGGWSTFFRE